MGTSTARALLGAAGCAVAVAAIYIAAYHVGPLADFDGRALRAVHALQTPEVHDRVGSYTEFLNLLPFSIAAGIVLVGALASGGIRTAAEVATIFIGANVTTQALQMLTEAQRNLPHTFVWLTDWPSGHVCAATTLAICVVVAAPAPLRPLLAGLGTIGVLAIAYGVLLLGAHRLSEALAGALVAGAWAAIVRAASRRPSGPWRGVALAACAGAVISVAVLGAVALDVSPQTGRPEIVVTALLMAVCAAVMVGASGLFPVPSRGRVR